MTDDHESNGSDEPIEVVAELATVGMHQAIDRAQLDVQIETAKAHPRSIDKALKEATDLATIDADAAGSMFYCVPRSGKQIWGPGVRLAEVMAYSWGNLRAEADIVEETATEIVAMATVMDLERNVGVRIRVRRRITDKHGRKYSQDMVATTANAAISIALRNGVFRVIPRSYVNVIYNRARAAALGKGTLKEKRQNALAWWKSAGGKEPDLYRLLDIGGVDDLGEEELIQIRGMRTAIEEGQITLDQILSKVDTEESDGAAALNDEAEK